MASNLVAQSELDIFKLYVDQRMGGSLEGRSLAQAIADFRKYQQQLASLRKKIKLSEESAERGGTQVLSEDRLNELCDTWEAELRNEGAIE